jgi:glycine reductase
MDLENQKRIKDYADQYGPENIVVVLGGRRRGGRSCC